MKKKFGVIGFYGQSNFGDDLFCFVIAKLMEANGEDYFIQNGLIRTKHNINVSKVPVFWRWNADTGLLGKLARIASNLDATLKAEKLIYGGGSVFGKYASFKQRELIRIAAKITNTKLYAFGVSLGPFKGEQDEKRYAKLLRCFKEILTRDKESFTFAMRNGLNAIDSCDMVWGLPSVYKKPNNASKKLLICLHRPLSFKKLDNPEIFFRNFEEINILNLDKGSVALSKTLLSELNTIANIPVMVTNYFEENIENSIDEFSTASFVVTSKLHGAITAAAFDVPFALLEYQPKCTQFVKSINGYENFLNHGDALIFMQNISKIFEFRRSIKFDAIRKSDMVQKHFKEMLAR
ncbi:hypothetical protein B9Z47_06075 [Limnohabitans sp. 2KL-1]|uniref:polysaccharide pyruvyl transferase family protein n=1 Tax=Limnohabitans sp. 2KL-1 TaxID=1100699 RepID=UPI000D3C66EC|nr:polysaccharide pyruvyl transferase family protein [Limnohabitans sp. 2KL-1]PUE49068.1 hypothetical protein B9Z47_06075 [Limnohabitans sp. 2KL-1]